MSRESFARGFCKVAEAYGVDAVQLAKFAQTQNATSSALLSAKRSAIRPLMKKEMEGARTGETRRFSPKLQQMVNDYKASGGNPNDLFSA